MTFTDNKGTIINVGDSIEWVVTVFKSKLDNKINTDNPLVMKEILTLEILNNEHFSNTSMFRNELHSGWDWFGLHNIDAECFNVSILKV